MSFHKNPVTFVSHVVLKVSDLEKSKRFYTEVLGLNIKEQTSNSVSFTTNGQDVLLTITQPKTINKKQEQRTGLYHFALLLPKRADLSQVVRHFIHLGVRFGGGDHLVSEAIYLNDPDGNGIEIYVDREASVWQWSNGEVLMTTDPVDFDDLLKESIDPVWNGLPKETVMGHIHLQVNDLAKNKEFYVDGLGFDVVSQYGREALFLSDSNYHHHIALNTWSGTQIKHAEKTETGIESYSIVFPSEEKRQETVASLRELGIPVMEEENEVTVFDPSDIKLKLMIG
ncbi:VOC family protein [Melissococcus sp. OM08-11BH]|uniref:VOC family protein n=1 Tax=Melissococcus sp. OM08-11BH TaxID=2293110 RepID=UPI000E4E4DAE|nr:VOC family protein [Melissococcus sp. OM08-11BH]RGI31906.1 VOC family protein [Melissococcus sp. OM08-11BH]